MGLRGFVHFRCYKHYSCLLVIYLWMCKYVSRSLLKGGKYANICSFAVSVMILVINVFYSLTKIINKVYLFEASIVVNYQF